MKAIFSFVVLLAVSLAGCMTPSRSPREVAHIVLETEDSPVVRLTKLWLERKTEALLLSGYVVKRPEATDTTQTHLDVTLFGADGRVLRHSIERFEPRQIPRRPRMPDSVTFHVMIEPLPPGTARIKVGAHEGPHDST